MNEILRHTHKIRQCCTVNWIRENKLSIAIIMGLAALWLVIEFRDFVTMRDWLWVVEFGLLFFVLCDLDVELRKPGVTIAAVSLGGLLQLSLIVNQVDELRWFTSVLFFFLVWMMSLNMRQLAHPWSDIRARWSMPFGKACTLTRLGQQKSGRTEFVELCVAIEIHRHSHTKGQGIFPTIRYNELNDLVSSPVKETLPMENFRLQGWPDTWPAGSRLTRHGAVLRCSSATTPH